jgi:competence protein ComEC
VPAFPPATLALSALGGLWLCLWRGRWRWWGAAVVAAGFALGPQTPPDLLIDGDGKLFAARREDGEILLAARGRLGMEAETWLRRAGVAAPIRRDPALRCDRLGCIAAVKGRAVAFVRDRRALAEDCFAADILLTAERVPRRCAAALVIDRARLARGGAYALWLTPSGVRVESVAGGRGRRPWARSGGPQ